MKNLKNVLKIVILLVAVLVMGYFIFTFTNLGAV